MTFAIVARCARTRQLGVGVTSFSMGVGSYCPLILPGVGALTSQSYSNPRLRRPAMQLLKEGRSPEEVLAALPAMDPHFGYRQFGIVSADGRAAGWTGSRARPWHGQIIGDGFVALGNALEGAHVVDAMAAAFGSSARHDMHERILLVLEAGREAGGQRYATGPKLAERSAVVMVYGDEEAPIVDLRVDAHETAIAELRRVRDAYLPFIEYYSLRSRDPANTPTHIGWMDKLRARPSEAK